MAIDPPSIVLKNPEPTAGKTLDLHERKRLKPLVLKEMAPHHKLLVDYMVHGCPHDWAERKTQLAAGTPLPLELAADVVGIRRRNARDLMKQPIMQRYMATELQALRDGHKAEAVHKVIGVMRTEGTKAADRKVQLEAASMILGEQGDKRAGVTVNVGVGVQVSPGYVIDLRPAADAGPVIEGSVEEGI